MLPMYNHTITNQTRENIKNITFTICRGEASRGCPWKPPQDGIPGSLSLPHTIFSHILTLFMALFFSQTITTLIVGGGIMTNALHNLSLPFDLFIQTIIPPHLHSSGCWRDLDSPPQQPGAGASGLHPHAALLLQPKLQGGNSQTMSNICCDGRYFASKDKILSKCYKCIDRHFSVSKNFTISLKFTLYLCLFLSFGSQISNAY